MTDRIYPPEGGFTGTFQDHEGYIAALKSVKTAMSNGFEGGPPELQLEVDWEVAGSDDTIRDWIGLALGIGPNGPSKLRQLLNALGEKKPDTWCWFNQDTLEWGYEKEGPAFSKLLPGASVLFRGVNGVKKSDGVTKKFSIKVYQPAPAGAAPAAAPPPPPTAAATTTFTQISPDGKHGWDGQAWIPIEAPIPPPPASIPPPPPPAPAASPSRRGRASSSAVAAPPAAGGDDEPPF